MRTVDITDLASGLDGFLQCVRNGEEIVIRDRTQPIARILPFDNHGVGDSHLGLDQCRTMPEDSMDWEAFFAIPLSGVPHDVAVDAAIAGRGDR